MSRMKAATRHSLRRRSSLPGTMPGILIPDPEALATTITVIAYSDTQVITQEIAEPEQLTALMMQWPIIWVNVIGLGDVDKISQFGKFFNLHPLALEDTVNTHQRAKVDDYQTHQFIVTHLATLNTTLKLEQISLYLGKNFVVSFLESPIACFKMVETRINRFDNRFRSKGPDYLVYALLDAIIDCYFPVLEFYSEYLDELEDTIILTPNADLIAKMHELKRIFTALKRDIWQQRDMINMLYRETNALIQPETSVYFRDCYDHTIQIIELLETQRERCTSLTDIYLSSMANRLNEIMKVLTIISTVFMPISFLASLWGMNFSSEVSRWNMPELRWQYGYPMALSIMSLIAIAFVSYFIRKKWISFR